MMIKQSLVRKFYSHSRTRKYEQDNGQLSCYLIKQSLCSPKIPSSDPNNRPLLPLNIAACTHTRADSSTTHQQRLKEKQSPRIAETLQTDELRSKPRTSKKSRKYHHMRCSSNLTNNTIRIRVDKNPELAQVLAGAQVPQSSSRKQQYLKPVNVRFMASMRPSAQRQRTQEQCEYESYSVTLTSGMPVVQQYYMQRFGCDKQNIGIHHRMSRFREGESFKNFMKNLKNKIAKPKPLNKLVQ